jgi:glyoxylase-like metal-dependent hydrolase (beta-lactamase superfamily II)
VSNRHGSITHEGEQYPSPPRELEYLAVDTPEPGRAVPIVDGLLWARIPLPMELTHINVWLMEHEQGWTLVDTGMAADPCRDAWTSLEDAVVGQRGLRRIFVTHDHPDHMGLARWLQQRHGAEVWMSAVAHDSVVDYLATDPGRIRERMHAFMVLHGLGAGEAPPRLPAQSHDSWFDGVPALSATPDDGDTVAVRDRQWTVIETGGHCRGHLCLHDPAGGMLISGDQVLPSISPNVSVLSSRPDADPLREFLASLARLEQCPSGTLVLPSHGKPFRGLHRRIADLRAHHLQQLASLREACAEPRTAFDLLPVMFGRPLRGFHRMLAMGEAVAHLNHLLADGLLEREAGRDGVARFVAT